MPSSDSTWAANTARNSRTANEEEIARVRAADPAVAREEIARSPACAPGAAGGAVVRGMLADPERAVRTLAGLLERVWEALVAPHWPRLRALLEADVSFHARLLAEGGLDRLFTALRSRVSWDDGTLSVDLPHDHAHNPGGEGVTLLPSAFVWPGAVGGAVLPPGPARLPGGERPGSTARPAGAGRAVVVYPARGVGGLWAGPADGPPRALARLLGAHRAAVLAALDEPASTTDLAVRLGLAPSSVSAHLRTLREAGLLSSHRVRHRVLYERTPLGASLADAGAAGGR
ncbi:DUF5937 family protein [Streptomyces sp. URMC 125]|uniref:ArsR/SmtB family transcription factor n=1 Tax=Streptomyces sp. URMC 125 TaxID=3423419 RepID=UPI003F1D47BF